MHISANYIATKYVHNKASITAVYKKTKVILNIFLYLEKSQLDLNMAKMKFNLIDIIILFQIIK